jgi:hypothetical protein
MGVSMLCKKLVGLMVLFLCFPSVVNRGLFDIGAAFGGLVPGVAISFPLPRGNFILAVRGR